MRHDARGLAGVAAAFAIGLGELGIFYSDAPASTGLSLRVQIAVALSLVCGFVLAYVVPARWLFLAFLSSWGAILLGAMGVVMGQRGAALVALGPPVAALAGAAAGRLLGGPARRTGSLFT